MKKIIILILTLALISICLYSCNNTEVKTGSDKIQIISTIFPTYDFARQVCGNNAEITQLLPLGGEMHSYEPTPQDIIKIQNCDLFIYVGGESDSWVDKILESMETPIKTIKMMECVNVVEEEIVEGMESETKVNAAKDPEYDEHVWTSPKNAIKITEAITKALCEIDAGNKDFYNTNLTAYIVELNQLDLSFTDFFSMVINKTIVVGDRFPLRYFADTYGLEYYAAFPGCSGETEPSAATIAFLIDKVKAENISTVFYMEFSNHIIADSIAEATGAKTAMLSACHNVSEENFENGATYISIMEKNLTTLEEAMK